MSAPQPNPVPKATPRRLHNWKGSKTHTNNGLTAQRKMLRGSTTGHTIQVTPAAFLDRYATLGKLTAAHKTNLMDHLRSMLTTAGTLTEHGWPSVTVKPNKTENETFAAISTISSEVAMYAGKWKQPGSRKLRAPRTVTRCDPNHSGKSEVSGGSMELDGKTVLIQSTTPGTPVDHYKTPNTHRSDTVASWEFKRKTTDAADNEDKVVSSSSHLLYNDPCRRFVFGVTIEHGRMRLWYFCRSHISVSEGFDFHKDPEPFIQFLVFLNFATTVELGYDPTVKRVRVDKTLLYHFKVGRSTYETVKVIDETAAIDIVTRATRVFAVKLVERKIGNKPVLRLPQDVCVLRDSWLYTGTDADLDIQNKMFAALADVEKDIAAGNRPDLRAEIQKAKDGQVSLLPASGELVEDAKKYFMTILADVAVKVGGDEDKATAIPTIFEEFVYTPHSETQAAKAKTKASVRSTYEPPESGVTIPRQQPHQHTARTHRRSIFKELCTPLSDIEDYSTFALTLSQVVVGLYYMCLAGFVHRDISPTNCLLHVASGQVKISDLEYGRLYVSSSPHKSPLTGTPEFMAVEYQRKAHFFKPQVAPVPAMSRADKYRLEKAQRLRDGTDPQNRKVRTWFRYNFLHDLESVAWIYAWFLFTKLPSCLSLDNRDVSDACTDIQTEYSMIFDGDLTASASRVYVLTSHVLAQKDLEPYHETVQKVLDALYDQTPVVTELTFGLNAFADLADAYREVQAGQPLHLDEPELTQWRSDAFLPSYYSSMRKLFDDIGQNVASVRFTAVSREKPNGKRRATEAPEGERTKRSRTANGSRIRGSAS